jgi:hypothetical protein
MSSTPQPLLLSAGISSPGVWTPPGSFFLKSSSPFFKRMAMCNATWNT